MTYRVYTAQEIFDHEGFLPAQSNELYKKGDLFVTRRALVERGTTLVVVAEITKTDYNTICCKYFLAKADPRARYFYKVVAE